MEKLVIVDHSNTSVHFFNVAPDVNINEEYIEGLGFHCSNCSYMFAKDLTINFHEEILK